MKLVARIPIEVGTTQWSIEFVEDLGDHGDCDGSSRTMRIEYSPAVSQEEMLKVAYHEWLHATDCIYKIGISESKVRILEQEFPRFLSAMRRAGLLSGF